MAIPQSVNELKESQWTYFSKSPEVIFVRLNFSMNRRWPIWVEASFTEWLQMARLPNRRN